MPNFQKLLSLVQSKKHKTGQKAEQLALSFLKKQKLQFIDQNFNSRQGEIDLIMHDDKTLIFIEVRYRQSATHGNALESITHQKQRRIILTAQYFLIQNKKYQPMPARFDVIAIQNKLEESAITWIKGAFQ